MKARVLIVVGVIALALPAVAPAKGPEAAVISGPGLDSALRIDLIESGMLEATGFIPAAFGQSPDPMLAERPKGDLGPRYTIAFRVPTGVSTAQTIRMDLYPYADGGALTYTKPGQRIYSRGTIGGWFRGGLELRRLLVQAGLPRTAPSNGSDFSVPFDSPWSLVTGIVLALLAGLGFAAVGHRRQTTATAR